MVKNEVTIRGALQFSVERHVPPSIPSVHRNPRLQANRLLRHVRQTRHEPGHVRKLDRKHVTATFNLLQRRNQEIEDARLPVRRERRIIHRRATLALALRRVDTAEERRVARVEPALANHRSTPHDHHSITTRLSVHCGSEDHLVRRLGPERERAPLVRAVADCQDEPDLDGRGEREQPKVLGLHQRLGDGLVIALAEARPRARRAPRRRGRRRRRRLWRGLGWRLGCGLGGLGTCRKRRGDHGARLEVALVQEALRSTLVLLLGANGVDVRLGRGNPAETLRIPGNGQVQGLDFGSVHAGVNEREDAVEDNVVACQKRLVLDLRVRHL